MLFRQQKKLILIFKIVSAELAKINEHVGFSKEQIAANC